MRPPASPVPPTIATAKLVISQSLPVAGCAEPIRETHNTAASAPTPPDSTCDSKIIRSVLIPASRAAS